MAECKLTVTLDTAGIMQVADIIAHLRTCNAHMTQQVTDLQTVSTAQVERIRSLESELARMKEKG